MLVIDDPQSWLDALPGPRGPMRCCGLHENLRPGDVTDDGYIARGPCDQTAGAVTVTIGQAHAAAYYGWAESGWAESGLRVFQGGRVLTQIFRYDPPCTTT